MSKRLDDALAALDVGLQTPRPDDTYGEISPRVSERCARCDRADTVHESEFCAPCRGFLLGDRSDPMLPSMRPQIYPRSPVRLPGAWFPSPERWDAAQDAMRRVAASLWESLTPVLDWWTEHAPMFRAAAMANPDQSLRFGLAAFVLDPTQTEFGWAHLSYEVAWYVYEDTAAFPTTTVSVIPGDDPLRVEVLVEWSSLDPALTYQEPERLDVEVMRDSELMRTNQFTFSAEWRQQFGPVGWYPPSESPCLAPFTVDTSEMRER